MIAALDQDKNRRYAFDVEKKQGEFRCPVCMSSVILKKGNKKIHHFSHPPGAECSHGRGETQTHLKCKTLVWNLLKDTNPLILEMEYRLSNYIPDVYVEYQDIKIAFEIQKSKVPVSYIENKTRWYSDNNIFSLWLIPLKDGLRFLERYSPSQQEKWLHQLYYGNVFYIDTIKGDIFPVKFSKYELYKEEFEDMGDYWYPSKRYRTLTFLPKRSLVSGFCRHVKNNHPLSLIPGAKILTLKDAVGD